MAKENVGVTYQEVPINELLEFAGREGCQIKRLTGPDCVRSFRAFQVVDRLGNEIVIAGIKNSDGIERVVVPNLVLEDFKNIFIGGRER